MKRQTQVFLMDGDALIIPQKRLMWILERIQEYLPWVKRVGAYANTKSIGMKSPQELVELRKYGLGMLYLGVETGDDEIRKKINKGSSAQHCLENQDESNGNSIVKLWLQFIPILGTLHSQLHKGHTIKKTSPCS
jgi:radical SAM superfamily enzyme YgiQ (UPF0313 family)